MAKVLLEHFHVPPHLVLERTETDAAEGLRHLFAELALLATSATTIDCSRNRGTSICMLSP